MRAMLVEDDDVVRTAVAAALRQIGFDVFEHASGFHVRDTIASARFDLLVTDIRLPGSLTGWHVARQCRDAQPDLPIVYMTSYTALERADLPNSRFLQKPFRPMALIRCIRDLIGDGLPLAIRAAA